MRFLHTADWQIGMRADHAGEAAAQVRSARLETARRVCDLTARERAEFLILAGDTFEDNGVDRGSVAEVVKILRSAQCPVYVLPGNHDPYQPGSVWEHTAWRSATNVQVLCERKAAPFAGGTLFPCPVFRKRAAEDPTAWIQAPETKGFRIGIAHGNVGEQHSAMVEGGYPIPFDAAIRAGLDYMALGHWHSTTLYERNRMAYAGTPEPTRFGEQNSGNVLVVEIAEPGAAPAIRPVATAGLTWVQKVETITAAGQLGDLARTLAKYDGASRTLIDVRLSGLLFERERDEPERIDKAMSRFLCARVDKEHLRPAPSDSDWIEGLPAGVIRGAAAKLAEMARGSGEAGENATQALLELYAIAAEVRR